MIEFVFWLLWVVAVVALTVAILISVTWVAYVGAVAYLIDAFILGFKFFRRADARRNRLL